MAEFHPYAVGEKRYLRSLGVGWGDGGGGYLRGQLSVANPSLFSLQVCALRTVEACGLNFFFFNKSESECTTILL